MSGCGEFLRDAIIGDTFWRPLREIVRREGIPYQWEALNDRVAGAEPSYCMKNFRIAAGKEQGEHGGYRFQDSDVAKWLEGVAYSLTWHPDEELERLADGAIDEIVAAQQPDGYLDTYYIINGLDQRWTNLMDNHELYCAGHMIEAAVAYYQATGKRKLLDAMIRFVDHIDSVMGADEGKLHGYPGHPVVEMALMRLHALTGDERHMRLAEYFVNQRGQRPLFFEQEALRHGRECRWLDGPYGFQYYQAGKPVREQPDAEGHAVRALYLYAGMADVARACGDASLADACEALWRSVTRRRMYITGAVGSSEYGEAFSFDYDLPNDTVYGETCAAIALVFFARRMLELHARGEYADVMERALYNGVISGMQLDGKRFFYVNPLEVVPEACEKDERKRHVKPERQSWFGCACCPPNLIRLLTSLQQYAYSASDDALFVHLYISGDARADVNGAQVSLRVDTNYPWDGDVRLVLGLDAPQELTVALRIPGWCGKFTLLVNGEACGYELRDGYAYIRRRWSQGDEIALQLPMEVKLYRANPLVREDVGQLAVMRGPIVFCLEECDNGANLHLVRLHGVRPESFEARFEPDTLGGVVTLSSPGARESGDLDGDALYTTAPLSSPEPVTLRWIPYYAWANRATGEMRVWVRE